MPRLTVSLLGAPRIERDGLPVALDSRKALALLAYLAIAGQHQSREVLITLLWPESDPVHAHNTLRYTLSVLKKAIGGECLDASRDTIGLHRGPNLWLDVDRFHGQLAACRAHGHRESDVCPACAPALAEAAALYQGDFLAGFTLRDSPAFDEWQFLAGEQLRGELASALERLARYHATQAAWEPAIAYARRRVALDPLHEPAQRQLIQVYAWAGRRAAALRQYHACARVVEQELGAPPSEETTELFAAIKEQRLAQLAVAYAPPAPAADSPGQALRHEYLLAPAEERSENEQGAFVARERELAQLHACLDRAIAGRGQVIFVTGEPGSGKTILLQEFVRRAIDTCAELIVAVGNCNAHTGIGDPYLPFREILALLTGDVEARSAAGMISLAHGRRLRALRPVVVSALVQNGADLIGTFVPGAALIARAASMPGEAEGLAQLEQIVERKATETGAPGPDQQRIFEQYTGVLMALTEQRPLLVVLDDLQWADAASVALLFHLSRRIERSRIQIVGAYRPDDVALGRAGERHPLEPVINELTRYFGDIRIDLDRSNDEEGRLFVDALLDSEPNRLGPDFRSALHRQTEGHPLFTVELLRGLQERGDLVCAADGRWLDGPALDWETLPARVEGAIAERIGRLDEALQEILAVASVEGELFTAEIIARVQAAGQRELVQRLSGELDRRQRLVRFQGTSQAGEQRLSRYRFRHFLFQKYLYNHLDAGERAYLHEDVGNALEFLYGDRANTIAAQLARHFAAAGRAEKAAGYLLQAGQQALRLSAHQAAIAHLTGGLELLSPRPETAERNRQELALQLALGATLQASRGYADPETGRTYDRARELCRQLGAAPDVAPLLVPALMGLGAFYTLRSQWRIGQELYQQILTLAEHAGDPTLSAVAHWLLGYALVNQGAHASALPHLEHMIAFYDPGQHHALAYTYGQDAGVSCLCWLTWALWHLGYPDQALRRSHEALELARTLAHPFSLAFALSTIMTFHFCRRDVQTTQALAAEAIAVSTEQGFPFWGALASIWQGWARAQWGDQAAGMAEMRQGMSALQATGAMVGRAHHLAMLAETLCEVEQAEEGIALLDEALTFVAASGEGIFEAELHRLKGELLLVQGAEGEAESCFRTAIAVARRQQARSLELRAATSLSRMLLRQAKPQEARRALAEIYSWFAEGFDTPDLIAARAMLERLT